jgi:oxygen-independent coproporphyrinogen-3 oxidase
MDLQPEHLSWYELTIEPNTAFYSRPPTLPEDDDIATINDAGLELLAAHGYDRYEVSAFARPDRQCRHNLNYWKFGDYLGIGAGAHGKLTLSASGEIMRSQRNRMPAAYLASDPTQGYSEKLVAKDEQPFEFLMNALRLTQGVPAATFAQRTFLDAGERDAVISGLRSRGYLDPDPALIRPSAWGLRYLNQCLAELLPDDNRIPLQAE